MVAHVEPEELLLGRMRGEGKERTEEKQRERERGERNAHTPPTLNDREREVQSAVVNYPFGRRRV